jgi:Rod binding domain-containing protein
MEINPLVGSIATGYGADSPKAPESSYGENEKDLKEVSKDFVSILFSQMFTVMRGNPEDEDTDEEGNSNSLFGGANTSMFMGFLDQEIGKKFTEQGGTTLVDNLYDQLKGNNVLPQDKITADKIKAKKAEDNKVIEKNKVI